MGRSNRDRGCKDKRQYASFELAESARASKFLGGDGYSTYYCTRCSSYHIGHDKNPKYQNHRRAR